MPALDHRRATAARNRRAILDAAERLLARRAAVSMASVAAEAGVSRPTLYAHFKTLPDVLEAAVQRMVDLTLDAMDAAEPALGPPDVALERMLEASWRRLAAADAVANAAAEHLSPQRLHRAHAPLIERTQRVIERGQAEGVFRQDLPALWLVTVYYSLIHGADELARGRGTKRADALAMLKTTVRDLLRAGGA